jgi:hypothetical protein
MRGIGSNPIPLILYYHNELTLPLNGSRPLYLKGIQERPLATVPSDIEQDDFGQKVPLLKQREVDLEEESGVSGLTYLTTDSFLRHNQSACLSRSSLFSNEIRDRRVISKGNYKV